ncbi:DUF3693 domain-containing protein [Lysobacter capsici]|uniref:DUF3693 domain-containing protein n=1 Tax=Lysobacter capsici TaxID=435897 RepID=UPI000699431F|nr:DUF3693 domain-containing protein [Lysobacter capsici]
MTALQQLLEQAIGKCSPSNGTELAKRVGVTRAAVSMWKQGGVITEKHLAALIDVAGVDASVGVEVLAEQATTKPERAMWTSLLTRLATAAMLAVVAFGSIPIANASIEQGIENPRVGGSIPSPATI